MSTGNLGPVVRQQAWSLGVVSPGAKLYTYLSGTTTPQVVYLDAARLTPAANPLVADANGRFAAFWLASVAYRMTLTDSADVVIWGPEDGITNVITELGSGATGSTLTLTGSLTLGDDLVFSNTTSRIRQSTGDGSDTGIVKIGAGGAVDSTRGALINLFGNESSFPGLIQLVPGLITGVGASLEFYNRLGGLALSIPGQTSGLLFPSSPTYSSNANTLDEFKEGTWTPTIGGSGGQSGQVYADQSGHYVKIGRFVWVSFRVTLSTLGTITTQVQIQGLPFTIDNVATGSFGTFELGFTALTTSVIGLTGLPVVNSATVNIFQRTAAATSSITTTTAQGDLTANTSLRGQFCYFANQ